LFRKPDDYDAFLRIVDLVQQRIPLPVICFCLMPNHWHLVLRPESDGDLSGFMKLLQVGKESGTGPIDSSDR
jgi:putative transposase